MVTLYLLSFKYFKLNICMVTLYLLSFKYFKLNILNMDYNTVTEDIIRLTDDLNTWSSTLCIPVKDSEALFDISSAANGADLCVPPGATNQPMTFPKSKGLRSVYLFDTEVFFGESSWDDLRSLAGNVAV